VPRQSNPPASRSLPPTSRANPPISRRERPAKPALTYEGIVGTAVRLMRAEGIQRVTMRRLAQELDTGAASLYVYVANTAELHAAILEDLLGAVDLSPAKPANVAKLATPANVAEVATAGNVAEAVKPANVAEVAKAAQAAGIAQAAPRSVGDWHDRLVAILASYTVVLFEHSLLARSALVTRPSGPNYLALVEAILALLHEGGMPDAQAAWAVDVLLQVATATAAEQSTRNEDESAAEEELGTVLEAVRNADDSSHPRIVAIGEDLFSGTPEERLSWTFHALINGALATPRVSEH
jgi:AcrR family transcriptional regulator